jgi:hypothetical protein
MLVMLGREDGRCPATRGQSPWATRGPLWRSSSCLKWEAESSEGNKRFRAWRGIVNLGVVDEAVDTSGIVREARGALVYENRVRGWWWKPNGGNDG